ncbi:hypothetical protein ABK040_000818 [Willaertia magna]
MPGRKDYITIKQIGKGSFGYVFKSCSVHGKKPIVAVKKIDREAILNEYSRERLQKEIEIHLNMNHENIVELYLYFEEEGAYYLVMELCENGELYRLLRKVNRFNESQAKFYFVQILEALLYLQSFGVIHRDLKLSNILLRNDFRIVKITDFGLSSRLHSPDSEQSTQLGTPNFMAYEIVNNEKYGIKADNWSLGCILFTMLVGQSPFDEKNRQHTFERIKKLDYTIPEFVSSEAADLIKRLLHPEPTKRISLPEVKLHPFLLEKVTKSLSTKPQQTNNLEEKPQPFNTNRIKPFMHCKSQTLIEILSDGKLRLEFNKNGKIFEVSKDGTKIWYNNTEYTFYSMPQGLQKYYEHARFVVETIKSKTPKIEYHSSECKCILMENSPMADFEVLFLSSVFSGARFIAHRKARTVDIRFTKDKVFTITLSKDLTEIVGKKDFVNNMKITTDIQAKFSEQERQTVLNAEILFQHIKKVKELLETVLQYEETIVSKEEEKITFPYVINAPQKEIYINGDISCASSCTSALNKCLVSSLSSTTLSSAKSSISTISNNNNYEDADKSKIRWERQLLEDSDLQ